MPTTPDNIAELESIVIPIAQHEYTVISARTDLMHYGVGDLPRDMPYCATLWPAAVALGHEVASLGLALKDRAVLELGAGVGLPGMVAARLGARVVQSEISETALDFARLNARENNITTIRHQVLDWRDCHFEQRFDYILGSEILYAPEMHPHLIRVFTEALAPGGHILISDAMREHSMTFLAAREEDGWGLSSGVWEMSEGDRTRVIGIFDLTISKGGS